MTVAAPVFDLVSITPSDEATTGKWFTVLGGKVELKVVSAASKQARRKTMKTINTATKQAGKDFKDLPIEVQESLIDKLMADNTLRGWSALVPEGYATEHSLPSRKKYLGNGLDVDEGYVLVDVLILKGERLELNADNARKVLDQVPAIRDEVATLSNSSDQFYTGGASALD